MRKTLALLTIAFAVGITGAFDAEAKRLGGGKSSGMQRESVTRPASPPAAARDANGTPAAAPQAAAPAAAATAGAPAAAAAKRSWMGPVAGIAAGLGIAALASHFGFGEALANILTIALVAVAVLMVVGLVMRLRAQRGAGPAPAYAGRAPTAFGGMQRSTLGQPGSLIGTRLGGGSALPAVEGTLPAGFDKEGFERNAMSQFVALQAAHDAGDLGRLAEFLTPDLLATAREDLLSRQGMPQTTQVFGLRAEVLEVVTEADRYVASVRFTGSVRTEAGAVPEALDEVWHLTKALAGGQGWLVAGIQQLDAQQPHGSAS